MGTDNLTQLNEADVEAGRRDIHSGLQVLIDLIHFVGSIHPDEYDPRMQAVLALAQKAGALLERGADQALGVCGFIGDAGKWLDSPSAPLAGHQQDMPKAQ